MSTTQAGGLFALTVIFSERSRPRWWTFAGWKANLALAQVAGDLRRDTNELNGVSISLDPDADVDRLLEARTRVSLAAIDLRPELSSDAVRELKFSECLPPPLVLEVVRRRLVDLDATVHTLRERVTVWRRG